MASTFTLKRKTYTAWDYCNDIAYDGFNAGYAYAIQKMYANSYIDAVIKEASKHRSSWKWAGKFGAEDLISRGLKKGDMPEHMRESVDHAIGVVKSKNPQLHEKFYQQFKGGYGNGGPAGNQVKMNPNPTQQRIA